MKKAIHQVAADVLASKNRAMTAQEVFEIISRDGLYTFLAKNPLSVLRSQMRRHSVNVRTPGSRLKYFTMTDDGCFELLPTPTMSSEPSSPSS